MLIFFLANSLNLFFICQRTSVTVFHVLSKIYTNAQFCFAWHPCTRIFRETYCLQIQCKIAKIPQEKRYFTQQSQNRHYGYLKALKASFGKP